VSVVGAALAIAEWPAVAEAIERARAASTTLRWHQALRRRIPEGAAESRVRGATASAELDGARLSVDIIRDLMRGAVTWHDPLDPVERVAKGAVAATAETEVLTGRIRQAPAQVLARLHTLAAADLAVSAAAGDGLADSPLGRPRYDGEDCRELVEIGASPPAAEARERLAGVLELLGALDAVPVPVVAALVHGELLHARPFPRANGVVARAVERLIVRDGGLDPTGVAVPEAGHRLLGGNAYLGALTAYTRGDRHGVELWVVHCADALVAAAEEGTRIADAVLAGRLT